MNGLFQNIFQFASDNERRKGIERLLMVILVGAILVNGLYVGVRLIFGEPLWGPSITVNVLLIVLHLGALLVLYRGYLNQTALILVISAWAGMTYQAWFAEGVRDTAVVVYILIILTCALILGWRIAIAMTVLCTASVWGLAIGEIYGVRPSSFDSPISSAWELSTIFIFVIVLIYLIVYMVRRSTIAVQESEEKFGRVFRVSPVAINITSLKDGRLLDANHAYWQLTGFDPGASMGKTTVELMIWENEAQRQEFVQKLLEEKSLKDPAYEFVNQKGLQKITAAFYELIEQGGEPTILSMFYDITEQVLTQRLLERNEEKYRNFVESSTEGIWFAAFDNPIPVDLPAEEQVRLIHQTAFVQDCNVTFARMYGYSSTDEVVGTRLLELYGGSVNDVNFKATLELVRSNYHAAERETVEKTVDGRTVYFLNSAIGVVKDGFLTGIWGAQLDITNLKQAQAALQKSEARSRALLEATPDMIFEFSRDGDIIQFIPSSTIRPFLPPDEFVGKNISDIMPSVIVDQTMFAISRTLETGILQVFEYELPGKTETNVYEASLIRNDMDTAIGVVRDVTVRKWAETEREKLIDELEAKNAELEQFTYMVSHDLKSPLITIKGFLGFVMDDVSSGNMDRLAVDVQRISGATEKMQKLLNDLLELSRVGRLINDPEPVDMNDLINEAVELVQGRIKQQNVHIQIDSNLPVVYADRQRILEVLQNLLDNAAKFMGEQSNPTIEVGWSGMQEGMPVLYVRDNGVGIPGQYMEKIFGLFNKLDARSEGTGIGLALVKRIIEFHGGRIWVESEQGHGATFYFTLSVPSAAEN